MSGYKWNQMQCARGKIAIALSQMVQNNDGSVRPSSLREERKKTSAVMEKRQKKTTDIGGLSTVTVSTARAGGHLCF